MNFVINTWIALALLGVQFIIILIMNGENNLQYLDIQVLENRIAELEDENEIS